ncbi:hypothetical protein [Hathewaya proteolytica]|nr:hypothetical protein [Hathewaya proteolytica]
MISSHNEFNNMGHCWEEVYFKWKIEAVGLRITTTHSIKQLINMGRILYEGGFDINIFLSYEKNIEEN